MKTVVETSCCLLNLLHHLLKICVYSNFRVEVRVIQLEVISLGKMDVDPFSCVYFKMC